MISLRTTFLKTLVHTLGRLSDGVTIARRHGFTSGKMLDYVYRNRPSGRGWIGRLLDRLYLSNRGWRAVRARRDHLVSLLQRAIRRQLDACGEVIFTIQTGQIHVHTTNAIFNGFDGEPLNMTVRPAELVHGWARQAGFDIGHSEVDQWHYHTVTVARKRPPGMTVKPRRTSAAAKGGTGR